VEPLNPYAQRQDSAPPAGSLTYPYDGGPADPVPMPKAPQTEEKKPSAPPMVPLEGRTVSLPAKPAAKPKYTYPAYGEEPGRTGFAQDRVTVVKQK
jgi:hypothetical protein